MTLQTMTHTTLGARLRASSFPDVANALPSWGLLALGAALALVTGPRWGIGALAWVAPVPFLLYARRARGWRPWAALAGVMLLAFSVQCSLIATPPVPVIATAFFGPPLALLRFGAIGIGEAVRRRVGEGVGILAYVTATVVLDWVGYGTTELGAWMATANTQVEWLPFLQLGSIAGLAGLGALMAWAAGTIARAIALPAGSARPTLVLAVTLVGLLIWGTFRLDQPARGPSVTVAAVTTDVGMTEKGMPDAAALDANTDALFERTRIAASRGARLVVWNEVATAVRPAAEEAFTARAKAMAHELGIDLVLAYAVLVTESPILLDNKYVFISDGGEILDQYAKHHPVPSEPSIRGTGPLRVLDRPYGRVGGAICYDYDFPALVSEHANGGVDLVVLPSSDWRGIDPVHTFMARARSIEGGFALVRSVRWAPSGAFDARGRARAWMPATDADGSDFVMVARLPVGRTPTLANSLGNGPVWLSGAVLLGLVGLAARRRREGRG